MILNKMWCPLCKSELVAGPLRCYETLDEHVCNPNGVRPERMTVVCNNQDCVAHQRGIFWADDGEGPYHTKFSQEYAWIDNNPVPFGSYHRQIHFSCSYHEEDRWLKLGKLAIKREVRYESDDYGHKTGKRVHYTICWNNVYWIPGIRMVHFSLQQFKREKKRGVDFAVKETRDIVERSTWPHAKWWRKAVKLWIRVFHPTIYKKALAKPNK